MNKLFTRDISVPDIKYRGLLGYREIRIFAWLCFAFSAMGIIFKLGVHLYSSWPGWAAGFEGWNTASEIIGQLPIALFLLANFSFIF